MDKLYLAEPLTRAWQTNVLNGSGFQLVRLLSLHSHASFNRNGNGRTLRSTAGTNAYRFAYHIMIDWTIFVIAFLPALIIAWLDMSFKPIRLRLD